MVETSSNHLLLQCTVKPSSSHLNSASPDIVVAQLLSLTLCDPLDCSVPGSSVLHYLPEFAQSHVHWVGDDIQPSHPLLLPSSSALHLSQHQGLFQWVDSSHQVTKYWSFRISSSKEYSGLISLLSKRLSEVLSSTTIWKYQFFNAQPSLWSSSHIQTWLLDKP